MIMKQNAEIMSDLANSVDQALEENNANGMDFIILVFNEDTEGDACNFISSVQGDGALKYLKSAAKQIAEYTNEEEELDITKRTLH